MGDVSTEEKIIRRRSTGETSQKKLRRKSKKVVEADNDQSVTATNTKSKDNTESMPVANTSHGEKPQGEKGDTEAVEKDGKNSNDEVHIKTDPDSNEGKSTKQKSPEEVEHKKDNVKKEEDPIVPSKSEAPVPTFRETVQKQVVGVIENALGMIGVQTRRDDTESSSTEKSKEKDKDEDMAGVQAKNDDHEKSSMENSN